MSYDWLRSYNRADIELPSGMGVTLSLVRAQDVLAMGSIPMPVLREMQKFAKERAKSNGDSPDEPEPDDAVVPDAEASPEVMTRGLWFVRETVRRTIRRVAPSLAELEGLPDDDDFPAWVVDKFDQDDFDAIKAYAFRETPLPAGSPA